ncbi:MAG: response regulator [Burkholderiaceae bacterium]|jgi:CheY-like chemotaxis protein
MDFHFPRPSRRLMVVDDDHDLADSICAWIRQTTDWTAVPAYGAAQAIGKAGEEHFDCVLLDIAMLHDDGFATAAMLHEANGASHPAILAMTGDAELRDAASTDPRFVASLLKPADSDRLLGLLAEIAART